MAERFDAPKPCGYGTPYASAYGGGRFFLSAEERDRFDSLIRTGAVRLDAADAAARLDARKEMIKREATLKPLGAEYFPKEK